MTREYIARDPRTGLPLNVGRSKKVDKKIVSEVGPWVSIPDTDVLPLALGEIDQVQSRSLDKTPTHARAAGVRALGRFTARSIHDAHAAFFLALEHDEGAVRVAALDVRTEHAVCTYNDMFSSSPAFS